MELTNTNEQYSGGLTYGRGQFRPTEGHVLGHRTLDGFGRARQNKRKIREATRLYADVITGRLDPVFFKEAVFPRNEVLVEHLARQYPGIYGDPGGRMLGLRETMSVTDYQALYVDVLDRLYYGYYNAFPIVNKALARIHALRDFRVVSRYLLDGAVTPFTSMDAAAPPPQRALIGPNPQDGSPATSTAPIQYQPLLYQAMTSVNWRAFVNDDLGIFKDLANRLAISGNRGISKFITSLYVDSNGPNATLYQTGYHNQITIANGASTNNPVLSTQGIIDALNVLASMIDSTGDPIMITGRLKLWYGPSLEGTANNVMNALSVFVQNQGGVGNTQGFPVQFLNVQPWMIQRLDPIMDPYIPIVCTGSARKTMWGITVDPESQARPSIEVGFLSGFETPQIYTKLPNTQRMGGGVDAMMGDFYSMDQDMKIVSVFGGIQIDGRSTVASTGLGV
jgi:hypothetical protein